MSRTDRVSRFRASVYQHREGMTNGCRVLLLRLADGASQAGIVSIPRSQLAKELGVDPARISDNVQRARKLGFLDIVRRGRPGVTAVYQCTIPPSSMVRKTAPDMVRSSAPLTDPTWCAVGGTQEGNARRKSERTASVAHGDDGSREDADPEARSRLRVVS